MEEICTEAMCWPQKRAFLIVPEQTKADMERRFLEVSRSLTQQSDGKVLSGEALMLVDVLSFHRFAHRILSDIGGISGDVLDTPSMSLLIHRVLSEGKSDFKVLSAMAGRIGYATEIDNVLGDFSRYGITPEMLRSVRPEESNPSFAAKMHDFALLIERVELLTEELGFCGRSHRMKRVAEVLEEMPGMTSEKEGRLPWPYSRLEYLKDSSIWIAGFGQTRNFTPEEYRIISSIRALCEELTVSVCTDMSGEGCEIDGFNFGRMTLLGLMSDGTHTEIVPVKRPRLRNPDLIHLADHFIRRDTRPYAEESSSVERVLFKNSMDELCYVAGKIKELVLVSGYRYNDISVVMCDPEKYESNLHAVFSEYGLDPFLDKRRKLSETAFMRFVISLLDLGASGWSYNSLMNCIKSGMCHITRSDADLLENYFLKHGLLKGYRIFEQKNYAPEKDKQGPDVYSLVKRVLFPIRKGVAGLSSHSTCAVKARLLMEFLEEYGRESGGISGQIDALATEWVDAGNQDASLALVASYNELNKLLVRLTGPMGQSNLAIREFRDMVQSGMDAALAGAIPSFVDQVRITDPGKGYQKPCKVMFLVGAARDKFPFRLLPEGYLRGREREVLSESLQVAFPSRSKDSAIADFFMAYALLDCPEKKLIMTSLISAEPSSVFRFIGDTLPKSIFLDNPEKKPHDPRLFSERSLARYASGILSGTDKSQNRPIAETICGLRDAFPGLIPPAGKKTDEYNLKIPSDMIGQSRVGRGNMSVSQIETYASCAFRYFASQVLHLEEREVFETDSRETGTIAHKIMEMSIREYIEALSDVNDAPEREEMIRKFAEKDFREWSEELFEKACLETSNNVSADPVLLMSSGRRIKSIAEKSLAAIFGQMDPEGPVPEEIEWGYGFGDIPPIRIRLPKSGRELRFRGFIDRVDIDHNQNRFGVLDYKTGDKRVDYRQLYAGLSVQLPAYLYAYSSVHPELMPLSAGYFHLTSPIVSVKSKAAGDIDAEIAKERSKIFGIRKLDLEPEDLRISADHAVHRIADNCQKLFDGEISAQPVFIHTKGENQVCSYCEYSAVCKIDPRQPPYVFPKKLPDVKGEDGKPLTEKEKYVYAIRKEMNFQKQSTADKDGDIK
jgi:ATP-dependent helicase/nuclease subunit B